MMIQGTGFVHSSQSINSTQRPAAPQPAAQTSSLAEMDQLDISPAADLASRSAEVAAVRHERVAQLRAAIEAGTYETDEKVGTAVERLLDQIG
jgi:anti-sigma28 factor (negative regulator of flagellin synthesis)